MMENRIGSTDLPCNNLDDDLLDIFKYAKGLASFITDCVTPMSIAIQGDWGTGKTSIIQYVSNTLDSKHTKSIYFNTWQYAQFNMTDNLYFSFLSCLLKEMGAQNGEGIKKIKESLIIAFSLASNVFLGGNGLSKDDIFKLVKQREDVAESVAELKKLFANEVSGYLSKNNLERMVIFVDDLDRLNPNVAVELLEIMKLFMDVEKCVFVLAIDYDVVIQGVRQKFGKDVSLAKCRSFFDKIIQLPFHMPVENYHLDKMIEKQFSEILKEDIQHLATFAKSTIGTNPRTFKRLYNSFLLIQRIKESQKEDALSKQEQSMLFCALCVQMNSPELYGYLAPAKPWYLLSEIKSLLEEEELNITGEDVKEFLSYAFEKNEEVDWEKLAHVLTGLDDVLRKLEKDLKVAKKTFDGVLKMSGITSVTPPKMRSEIIKVSDVEVLGEKIQVTTGAQAIKETFLIVLKAHQENLNNCIDRLNILSRDERNDSVFRSKEILNIGDERIYLGTSSSTAEKLKSLDRLVALCSLKKEDICWKNGETSIYPR